MKEPSIRQNSLTYPVAVFLMLVMLLFVGAKLLDPDDKVGMSTVSYMTTETTKCEKCGDECYDPDSQRCCSDPDGGDFISKGTCCPGECTELSTTCKVGYCDVNDGACKTRSKTIGGDPMPCGTGYCSSNTKMVKKVCIAGECVEQESSCGGCCEQDNPSDGHQMEPSCLEAGCCGGCKSDSDCSKFGDCSQCGIGVSRNSKCSAGVRICKSDPEKCPDGKTCKLSKCI